MKQGKEISNDEMFDLILTFKSDARKDDIGKHIYIERILFPALQSINQPTKGFIFNVSSIHQLFIYRQFLTLIKAENALSNAIVLLIQSTIREESMVEFNSIFNEKID